MGTTIADLTLDSLHEAVAWSNQDAKGSTTPIRANLRYARRQPPRESGRGRKQRRSGTDPPPSGRAEHCVGDRGYRLYGGREAAHGHRPADAQARRGGCSDEATAHMESVGGSGCVCFVTACAEDRAGRPDVAVIAHRLPDQGSRSDPGHRRGQIARGGSTTKTDSPPADLYPSCITP